MADRPLICFSHLRWDFVHQRPQHLLCRFARQMPVYYIEEPIWAGPPLRYDRRVDASGVVILTPMLPSEDWDFRQLGAQQELVERLIREEGIEDPVLWYYTPMALDFSRHLDRALTVFDCMDELAAFAFAPPELLARETELLKAADLVFTGGHSLFEAKRTRHESVHLMPSSVDAAHFATARKALVEPADQAEIPHPRIGYFGVIDERLDYELIGSLARLRPDWHIVMVGPTAKVEPEALPQAPNIHYLGGKPYAELPSYLAGWDVCLMPFARNEATRFISPTKTPEYLAAGKPVVSTPIPDVVSAWQPDRLVRIAEDAGGFIPEIAAALGETDRQSWLERVDAKLAGNSWDATWHKMAELMAGASRTRPPAQSSVVSASFGTRSAWVRNLAARYDYLIVGAGFAGSVLAERLASGSGKSVLVVDRRPHIGGNAYDCRDAAGILIHRYGPHIFHTNSPAVAEYLSRFTRWRPYEHRVLSQIDDKLVPIPINRTTINTLYGLNLTPTEIEAFLATRAVPVDVVRTSEDVVLSRVGRELYEKFFRHYTRKQWNLDPSELDKAVTARIPVRYDDDDRYFTDSFQNMPRDGFTRLFENMLDQPGITLSLSTDYRDLAREAVAERIIFTGPIDEFFDHRYGKLPYRSIELRHETLDRQWLQPVAVVNYPSPDPAYTRITEYKHLTGQQHARTSISYEFPCDEGDPYYPVPKPENAALYQRYRELADTLPDLFFVGRLGSYRYYNMDQIVAQALSLYGRLSAADTADPPRVALEAKRRFVGLPGQAAIEA